MNFSELAMLSKKSSSCGVRWRYYVDNKPRYFAFKRAFDIVISLMVTILILSWLFPLVAILMKLESGGPVLFIQKRVGKGGRSFNCLKFRSMVTNEQANSHSATTNDRRITKLGRFLRVSNLDEFPQFLNVLMGDMSVVGPRPHMHADCAKFSALISRYKLRNLVKPGITGLAQIKGFRGPTNGNNCIIHRYRFDVAYVKGAGFRLDVQIIWVTAVQTIDAIFNKLVTPAEDRQPFLHRRWVVALRSIIN